MTHNSGQSKGTTGWWPWRQRSPFFALLQVQRRTGWRRLLAQMGGTEGSKRSYILLAFTAVGLIPALFGFFGFAWSLQAAYVAVGQPQALLTLLFVSGQVICLVFGIGYIVSAFYFDTESKLLAPLPLKPELIAAARFWRVLTGEYLTIGVFMAPFIIAYTVQVRPGLPFWLGFVPVFLLLPVAPLAVSGIVAVLFMRLTAGRASRDVIRALGISVIMLLSIGVSLLMQRSIGSRGPTDPNDLLAALQSGQLQLVDEIGRYLPTTIWATRTVTGAPGAVGAFLAYVLTTAVALAVLLWLARHFLLASLLDPEAGQRKRRRLSSAELARNLGRRRSPLAACLWREAILLLRQPLFLINALVGNLLLPVFLVVPLLVNPEAAQLFGHFTYSETIRPGAVLGAIGLAAFSAGASNIGSTAISREGKLFWISRALPVAPRLQALAKQCWATVWGVGGTVVIVGFGIGLFAFNPGEVVLTLIGGALVAWLVNGLGLIVDLTRPNLTWTDPQQAMKGNWNALIALLLMLLAAVVVTVLTLVFLLLKLPPLVTVFVLLAVGAWLVWWRLGPLAERQYVQLGG